jgi:hypothetical protein
MAQQGQYTGDTVLGVIGEDVGLGQIVYSKGYTGGYEITKGVWYVATADGADFNPSADHQLGVAVQAGTYTPITATQSGTEIIILLKGYYSPGVIYGGGYCGGGMTEGGAVYLMSSGTDGSTRGCINGNTPLYTYSNPATHSIVRIVGYCYDIQSPFIIRFEPDKGWIEIS